MDIGLILILIVINGIFSMSEMSVVSSRKARLQKLAAERRSGANTALKLHEEPSRFLSTIQIGITSVGILTGALGEDTLAVPIYEQLVKIPAFEPHARGVALTLTVVLITYFSVVVGELVPKRLALLYSEGIAVMIARPMSFLSRIASPLVWLLSASGNLLLRLIGAHRPRPASVTNEEIRLLMEMGSETGVFHASESKLVSNVLRLDEQRVGAIMTPRKEVFTIDLAAPEDEVKLKIADCRYERLVVCRDGLENVLGILHRGDLLKSMMEGRFDIEKAMRPPLYMPDSITLTHLLELFRKEHDDIALIVDEYGELEGLVTLTDVFTAIVGNFPTAESELDPDVVQREDGSWLIDGGVSIARLKSVLDIDTDFPGEADKAYNTTGGFILYRLERVPHLTDSFEYGDWRFEVVDLDGTRIDKILITRRNKRSRHKTG
jgi:putative hemolysin